MNKHRIRLEQLETRLLLAADASVSSGWELTELDTNRTVHVAAADSGTETPPRPAEADDGGDSQQLNTAANSAHVYHNDLQGTLTAEQPAHVVTLQLRAEHRLSVRVTSTADNFLPRVSITNAAGEVLAQTTAQSVGTRGPTALIQAMRVPADGAYRVQVDSADGVLGKFDGQVLLNASFESETWLPADNSAAGTAQSLVDTHVSLAPNVQHSVVYSTIGASGGQSDVDLYSLPLVAGSHTTFQLDANAEDTTLRILDHELNLLALATGGIIREFRAPQSGDYFVQIAGAQPNDYGLMVIAGATLPDEFGGQSEVTIQASGAILDSIETTEQRPLEPASRGVRMQAADGKRWRVSTRGIERSGPFGDALRLAEPDADQPQLARSTDGREAAVLPYTNQAGLTTSRRVYLPEQGGFMRVLDSITNTTAQPQTATFNADTELTIRGSALELAADQSGDAQGSIDDRWMIWNDDREGRDMPATIVWGQTGIATGLTSFEPDLPAQRFTAAADITIKPGETKSMMYFLAQDNTVPEAIERAESLSTLSHPGALDGLTAAERESVVNWRLPSGHEYPLDVLEGDQLRIAITAPQPAVLTESNDLQPVIELLSRDGQLLASSQDGAPISHAFSESGTILLRVSGGSTSGAYVLSAQGSSAAIQSQIQLMSPTPAALLPASPQQVVVQVDGPVAIASVQPSDLTVGGHAASTVEVLGGDELRFTLSQPVNGQVSVQVAPGAWTDVRGAETVGLDTTITIDSVPASVVSTSVPPAGVLDTGTHTLSVQFSKPVRGDSLTAADVRLAGVRVGDVAVTDLVYDSAANTLQFQADLPEDAYHLILPANADGLQTFAGVPFDGDGDGTPGGDFSLQFSTDLGVQPIRRIRPTAFAASGVFQSETTQQVSATDSDVDHFQMTVPPGATVSFAAQSDEMQPTLQLFDDANGTALNRPTASGGARAQLTFQNTRSVARPVTLHVSGDAAGRFTVQAALQAAFETEADAARDNHTLETAQAMDAGWLDASPGLDIRQTSVLGTATTGDIDTYSFVPVSEKHYTISAKAFHAGTIGSLRLLDAAGNTLYIGEPTPLVDQQLSAKLSAADGQSVYIQIEGTGAYQLTVQADATFEQQFDAVSQPLDRVSTVIGNMNAGRVLYLAEEGNQQGLFAVDTATGEWTPVGESNTEPPIVGLSPSADPNTLAVHSFDRFFHLNTNGEGVAGDVHTGEHLITALAYDTVSGRLFGGTTIPELHLLDPQTGQILQTLATPLGEISALAFGGGVLYALHQSNTRLAAYDTYTDRWRDVGDTGQVWSGLAYDDEAQLLFAVRGDSQLHAIDPRTANVTTVGPLMREVRPNEFHSLAGNGGLAILPTTATIAPDIPTSSITDNYTFTVPGNAAEIGVRLQPLAQVDESTATLQATVQLLREDGTLISQQQAGAAGSTITFSVPSSTATTTYKVSVQSSGATAGRYALQLTGDTSALVTPPTRLLQTQPSLEQLLEAPRSLTLEFDQPLLGTSVTPDLLTINGVPAVGAALVGARAVEFQLPSLLAGEFSVTLQEGLIDAVGRTVPGWESTFTVAPSPVGPASAALSKTTTQLTLRPSQTSIALTSVTSPTLATLQVAPSGSVQAKLRVIAPDGTLLVDRSLNSTGTTDVPMDLGQTGVYRIELVPEPNDSGTLKLTLVHNGIVGPPSSASSPMPLDSQWVGEETAVIRVAGQGQGGLTERLQRIEFEQEEVRTQRFQFTDLPRSLVAPAVLSLNARGISSSARYQLEFEDGTVHEFDFVETDRERSRGGTYQMRLPESQSQPWLADGVFSATLSNLRGGLIDAPGEFLQMRLRFTSVGEIADQYQLTLAPGTSLTIAADDGLAEAPTMLPDLAAALGFISVTTESRNSVLDLYSSTLELRLTDASGAVVATSGTGGDWDAVIEYASLHGGTYTLQVRAADEYALVLARGGTIDVEPNQRTADALAWTSSGVAWGGIGATGTLYYMWGDEIYALGQGAEEAVLVQQPASFLQRDALLRQSKLDWRTGLRYETSGHNVTAIDHIANREVDNLPPSPIDIHDLALAPEGMFVTGTTLDLPEALGFYSFESRQWSVLGPIPDVDGTHQIEYDPTLDVLYAYATFEQEYYQIDPRTLQRTSIGQLPKIRGDRLLFVPEHVDPTGLVPAMVDPGDRYAIAVSAGDTITLETHTTNPLGDRLNPMLRLVDADGNLLAEDHDGAPDGQNARIEFTATQNTEAQVIVSGEHGTTGSYRLTLGGDIQAAEFAVRDVAPSTGDVLAAPPSSLVVQFTDQVNVSTVQAADLQINGVDAIGVQILDSQRVQFDLPPLLTGQHRWQLAAESMRSVSDMPLLAAAGDFTIPAQPIGPKLAQAHALTGDHSISAGQTLGIPVPLDDNQTLQLSFQSGDFSDLQDVHPDGPGDFAQDTILYIQLLDPRGRILQSAELTPNAHVKLPVYEIAHTGTHQLRIIGIRGHGSVATTARVNATFESEPADATGANDSIETAEVLRSRDLTAVGNKLAVLQGNLVSQSVTLRRSDGTHGGSPVTHRLQIEHQPQGDGVFSVYYDGDLRGENRYITFDVEGIDEPIRMFEQTGQDANNQAQITIPLDKLPAAGGSIQVTATPSYAIGDQPDYNIGARIDYPAERYRQVQRQDNAADPGKTTSFNWPVPDQVYGPGLVQIRARGDFDGPDKYLTVRVGRQSVRMFENSSPALDGIYTAEMTLTAEDLQGDVRVRLRPSPAVGAVEASFVELVPDLPMNARNDATSFGTTLSASSPTHFRIPVPQQVAGDATLKVRLQGLQFPAGDTLHIQVADQTPQLIYGNPDGFDVARREVRLPISQSTLDAAAVDGYLGVALFANGIDSFGREHYVEVQLDTTVDQDLYKIDLATGQSVDVAISTPSWDDIVRLQILDSAGQIVAGGDSTPRYAAQVRFESPESGSYYLRLTGRGQYQMTAGLNTQLERDSETATNAITSNVIVGAFQGRGGLITAADRNERIHIIDSASGADATLDNFPQEVATRLLGPVRRGRDLFAGVQDDRGQLWQAENNVTVTDLATNQLTAEFADIRSTHMRDVAFGGGSLFGVGLEDSLLYRFDASAGRWIIVGDTGLPERSVSGLAFDDAHHVLYALAKGNAHLLKIDPRTAEVTNGPLTSHVQGGLLAYFDAEIANRLDPQYLQSGDASDQYQFTATAGDSLQISLAELTAGLGVSSEVPIRMELSSPNGDIVATNTATLPSLDYLVEDNGSYILTLTPLGGEPRTYQLQIDGNTDAGQTELTPLDSTVDVHHARWQWTVATEPQTTSIPLSAGQQVTLVRYPVDGAVSAAELLDPAGNVVLSLPAAQTLLAANKQTFVTTSGGHYQIRATGAGHVDLQLIVGADLETESVVPTQANNQRSDAQPIQWTPVLGGGERSTVVSLGEAVSNDADYYRIDAEAGEVVDIAFRTNPTNAEAAMRIENAQGDILAEASSVPHGVFSLAIARFTAPFDGPLWLRVDGASDYSLLMTRDVLLSTGNGPTPLTGLTHAVGAIHPTGVLYFAADRGIDGGLWVVDTENGQTYAAGNTGETASPGLAPFSVDQIFGSFGGQIGKYSLDQSGVDVLPLSQESEGLAYDKLNHRLYSVWGGQQFELLDADTGQPVRQLQEPPAFISGLAFGNDGVYALGQADGATSGHVWFYDPTIDQWEDRGATSVGWSGYGLALNPFTNQLYAKRVTDTQLYTIDLDTLAVESVGDTGKYWGGGLAFLPDVADPTGNGATFSGRSVFSVELNAEEYEFVARAAAAGPGALDPRLEIYDSAGTLLVADEDGAANGSDALLRFRPGQGGQFEVHVVSENASSGGFQLQYKPVGGSELVRPVADLESLVVETQLSVNAPLLSVSVPMSEPITVSPDAVQVYDQDNQPLNVQDRITIEAGQSLRIDLSQFAFPAGKYTIHVEGDHVIDADGLSMASDLVIGPLTVALPGDTNLDGAVDFADFLILSHAYGQQQVGWHQGDFDADGRVSFADFLLLSSRYGQRME